VEVWVSKSPARARSQDIERTNHQEQVRLNLLFSCLQPSHHVMLGWLLHW
jgi:hypothetical protein